MGTHPKQRRVAATLRTLRTGLGGAVRGGVASCVLAILPGADSDVWGLRV